MAEKETRPTPEALLAEATKEGRGRLKIFLGAAPGVGKTYAMLEAAKRLAGEGVDVVVGIIETHGRAETEALTAGLEAIPRRRLSYRGRQLTELDLDALLALRDLPGVETLGLAIGSAEADPRVCAEAHFCLDGVSETVRFLDTLANLPDS